MTTGQIGFIFAGILLVIVVLITGCARVTVKPITKDDRQTPGVRYYESEPYLLITKEVTSSNKETSSSDKLQVSKDDDNYKIQIIWLPNYNKGYIVNTKSGLGSANATLKLANGWQLTEFGNTTDTKIPDTITAVTGLVKAVITKGVEEKGKLKLSPGLYRLTFDEKEGYCKGFEKIIDFQE